MNLIFIIAIPIIAAMFLVGITQTLQQQYALAKHSDSGDKKNSSPEAQTEQNSDTSTTNDHSSDVISIEPSATPTTTPPDVAPIIGAAPCDPNNAACAVTETTSNSPTEPIPTQTPAINTNNDNTIAQENQRVIDNIIAAGQDTGTSDSNNSGGSGGGSSSSST